MISKEIVLGLLIPFIGTALGSAMVFFLKKEINPKVQKLLLGFASGVMIAASVWSLIIPSIEMEESQGGIAWLPASIGFLLGIIFFMLYRGQQVLRESFRLFNDSEREKFDLIFNDEILLK